MPEKDRTAAAGAPGEAYIIRGEKAALRPMEAADCGMVARWRNSDRVRLNYIYMELLTEEDERRYFRDEVETGHVLHLIICDLEDGGAPVGCVVVNDLETVMRAPDTTPAEIGFFLGEERAAGRGIAREAMRLGIEYCFDTLGIAAAYSRIFTFNLPSILSCESVGMRKTQFLPAVVRSDGSRRDMYRLEITPQLLREAKEEEARRRAAKAGDAWKEAAPADRAQAGGDGAPFVSFVIPCYRSARTLPDVVAEIDGAMADRAKERGGSWEIVMVNDGAPDETWDVIRGLCAAQEGCGAGSAGRTGICLARNFGQHSALMAGIARAAGDIVICLDDDGQTPASEAGRLIDAVLAGADVAYASYDNNISGGFRSFGTRMNDRMATKLLGKPADLHVTSYFAMRRFVADEICRYENPYPYLIGLILRTTRSVVNVPVTHRKRASGASGYTLAKLFGLWLNGFTAFSVQPLRAAAKMGVLFALAGFAYGIYTIVKKFLNPAVPAGFSALMSAVVFIGGVLMLMLGMVGEYVGRTYISVNNAPQYVIRDVAGGKETSGDAAVKD